MLKPKSTGVGHAASLKYGLKSVFRLTIFSGVDFPYVSPADLRLGPSASGGSLARHHDIRLSKVAALADVAIVMTTPAARGNGEEAACTVTVANKAGSPRL